MLHHGSQCDRYDGDDGGSQHSAVSAIAEQIEYRVIPLDGISDPCSLRYRCKVNPSQAGSHHIGADHADDNGYDLNHALTPDIAHDHKHDRNQGDGPIRSTVGNSRLGKCKTDSNNDGTRYHGREKLHDSSCAEQLDQSGKHQIHKTCAGHTETGIGDHLHIGNHLLAVRVGKHGTNCEITTQKGKG